MTPEAARKNRLTFGPFEVDAAADELLRGGTRIRLPGQPFQILLLLLAQPGHVVSREQLREHIWSEGTFVDFEHGLNAAMNKLRRALGDSADNPRYIETIPGRGYRFIGNVQQSTPAPHAAPYLVNQLTDAPTLPVAPVPLSPPRTHLSPRVGWSLFVAGAFLVVAIPIVILSLKTRRGVDTASVVQFQIPPEPGAIFAPPIARQSFAISPDGTRLAFTVTGASGTRIWMRDLSLLAPHPIPGTEGAWSVFWSPDGHSIFYSVKRDLRQTNVDSNTTHTVATLPWMAMYGAWRSKEELLFYLGPVTTYALSTRTGELRELSGVGMRWAQFLPDSDTFLHVVFDPAIDHYRAFATSFSTRKSVPLMETDSRVQFAAARRAGEPAYLLFIRGESLMAQAFDPSGLQVSGEPFPIAQNVIHFRPSATASFSVSENGILVYQAGAPVSELRWYDRAGRIVATALHPAAFSGSVRVSQDGRRVIAGVWSQESGGSDIWMFGENGRESHRLTYPPSVHTRPVWSPDGKRIVFGSSHTGAPELAILEDDASGKERPIPPPADAPPPLDQIQIPTDWSRDGRFIVYDDSLGEEERQVWIKDMVTKKIYPLLQSPASQWGAAFSPDGKHIAFVSDQSGRPEVYLQPFEASPTPHISGERVQVSHDGAWLVRWKPDGRELYFVGMDSRLYAAPFAHGGGGDAKPLFLIPGNPQYGTASDFQFDTTANGQFVMTTVGSAAPPPFTVVQNWQSGLHH
ncbi:hypothetical protein BH10ACI4_BH10ACI4_33660 [soil metagenome]